MARCLNPDCNKLAKPSCAAPGYCRWSCGVAHGGVQEEDVAVAVPSAGVVAVANAVGAVEVEPCALVNCQKMVKSKNQYWRPFCSYSCDESFKQVLANIEMSDELELECPICGWTHFSDPFKQYDNRGYPRAGQWMAFHLCAYHGSPKVAFVQAVQRMNKCLAPKPAVDYFNAVQWYEDQNQIELQPL